MKNSEKIRIIEMYFSGFEIREIQEVVKVFSSDVKKVIHSYEENDGLILESKLSNIKPPKTYNRKIIFEQKIFNSNRKFCQYLQDVYSIPFIRTKNRLNRGATPDECILSPEEFTKRQSKIKKR